MSDIYYVLKKRLFEHVVCGAYTDSTGNVFPQWLVIVTVENVRFIFQPESFYLSTTQRPPLIGSRFPRFHQLPPCQGAYRL